jgi:hypothetical protein
MVADLIVSALLEPFFEAIWDRAMPDGKRQWHNTKGPLSAHEEYELRRLLHDVANDRISPPQEKRLRVDHEQLVRVARTLEAEHRALEEKLLGNGG